MKKKGKGHNALLCSSNNNSMGIITVYKLRREREGTGGFFSGSCTNMNKGENKYIYTHKLWITIILMMIDHSRRGR